MFMKTRQLIVDRQLKRKLSASRKLFMISRKKQKTEHSSGLGDQVGFGKKLIIGNADGVDEGGKTISRSCKKANLNSKAFITKSKSTRKLSSIIRKTIRGRKKRKMEKVDKVDEIFEPMDRISELPEPIIHHILSLLRCPKDVARTTVWSKKWRSIWASFFTFDFDQNKFKTSGGDHTEEKFISWVNNSLVAKLEPMHSIQKFKVSLSHASIKLKFHMYNWINAAINKDVKELEIYVEEKKKRHYLLPNTVLTAKTLTSLKLYGCKFDGNFVIDLCNLKVLSIKNAHVNEDMVQSFIQSCPLVEDLRLVHCRGIGRLHISTMLKLRTVQLHECHGLVWVKIELPSLVSFLHWMKESWECKINLAGCENLKCLTMKDPNLTDVLFQEWITEFPCLQKIVLRECNRLEQITILSRTLKELSVIRCKNLKEAFIDAPSLSALEYSGDRMPFSITHIAGLHEVKLSLQGRRNNFALFRELEHFLQKFEINRAWKLVVSSNKNITIREELRKIKHLSTKDVKIELIKSPMKLKGYVDNLLRMSRPTTLSLVSSSSSELLKFMTEKIMSREENPKCCTYYEKKCWLHYVKDVTMVVLGGAENGDTSRNLQQTTFKFNWQSLNLRN